MEERDCWIAASRDNLVDDDEDDGVAGDVVEGEGRRVDDDEDGEEDGGVGAKGASTFRCDILLYVDDAEEK